MVGDGERRRHRRIRRSSALGDDAACRLGEDVAARALHPGTARTPRASLREDDPRIGLFELLEPQSQAVENADPVVGEHDVTQLGEAAHEAHPFGVLQVDREASLAAVHRVEVVRQVGVARLGSADQLDEDGAAQVAAFLVLDLDDVGAEVRQKEPREGPLDLLSDLDHLDSFEGSAHWVGLSCGTFAL